MKHLVVVFILVWSSVVWAAPSKQYTTPGVPYTFADAGQTPAGGGTLVQMTFSNLPTQQGRVSTRIDKGAGAQPSIWEARCRISLTGTNVLGQDLQYYIASSDGTDIDNGLSATDANFTSVDSRRNLRYIGSLVVYQTTTNTTMYASFNGIYIPSRYFSVVIFNNTTLSTETSTTKHRCVLTPQPFEMQ